MEKKKQKKIAKYPRQYQFSIGIVIVGVIFIYMLYHLFTFVTAKNITVYEVSQGAISSNLDYNALAIRDETVYYSDLSGKILYLAQNFGRVGVKTKIYAIDEAGDIVTNVSATSLNDSEIDQDALNDLQSSISTFTLDYSSEDYYKTYSFKTDLGSQLGQLYNLSAMNSMEDAVNAAISAGTFHIYSAPTTGLIVYSIDGLEDLTLDSFTAESFDSTNHTETNLKSQQSVEANQPIYKLVNSDYWNLVCEIDESVYNELSEENYLEIEFLEDQTSTWTSCNFEEKYGKYYLELTLDDSMPRFADERFVHIKILDKDISGLKIPNSSIVTKKFFTIPKSYFYQGSDSSDLGLLVDDNGTPNYITPTIYYETDDYYYIDNELIHSGDIIQKSDSLDKYEVGTDTASLEGVYNVNKGYAIFKQIEILYQNEDYTIIKTGTNYGIAMYDHIVLQGDAVEENTIIN